MLQHNHATEREYPRRPMNLRILPTRYAHQNTAPWCMYALVVWRSALCCRPHWSHSHLDFGAVLFCILCSTSTMAQVRAQRPRMSPEWCSIRTNVKSKISSTFLSWRKWIFRNSTAVSPQCLPRFSAEWNISYSSNSFQNCSFWFGQMCFTGRFQRHTRKIDFAQNKSGCGSISVAVSVYEDRWWLFISRSSSDDKIAWRALGTMFSARAAEYWTLSSTLEQCALDI